MEVENMSTTTVSSTNFNEIDVPVVGVADETSQAAKHDCHNVVKSSGLGGKKRFCCEHGHKCSKVLKVSVACQTDSTEDDLDFKSEQGDTLNDDVPNGSSAEPQTVAHELCNVKDDDSSKPEGTLRLMIHNFRNMNDTVRGPPKLVSGVPWKIMVMPRQHVVAKKGTQKCLGFFLQCCPESYSDSWSCQAAAELRLISQKPGVPNFVRKTNHIYTAKENDWGYSCFMTWADILDESQGYMKDESVILEVFVKAEQPKGILTHDAFCKKIQDYMRLADMQCSRNLIDKALEVNQTALKFCKDKDELMKEELEKQKTRLIERKLKQSIERIEKADSKQLDSTEAGTNLNNLRQALAGNLAAYKTAAKLPATATTGGTQTTQPAPQSKDKPALKTTNNVIVGKDSTIPALNNSKTKSDVRRGSLDSSNKESETDQRDVKTIVDNLVSSLTKDDTLSMQQLQNAIGNAGVLDMFVDDDPCCSDQSDDDDSDYEDIDEVCDSCLVEKLDHMSGATPIIIEAQDMSCQTDFQPTITSKSRLTPIGAVAAPPATLTVKSTEATVENISVEAPIATNPPNKGKNHAFLTKEQQQQLQLNAQIRAHNAVKQQLNDQQMGKNAATMPLSDEDEHKLLKLISEESKASLNSIKDTLERLVSLAQGGENTNMPLPFDLNQLSNHHLNKSLVKTDIIDIPLPANTTPTGRTTPTLPPTPNSKTANTTVAQQQQQQIDVNQQMAQIKQMMEFKRRHPSPPSLFEDETVAAIQRQQFVQTDLSYVPREPSPTNTDEDDTILRQAREMVDNKAEELVSRYSQLIEQSEANRLAETVKKVEKRMKDIEKQTMTCRKELSDECERHHREEQKLIKLNKQLKQQLDQANEKLEKLNTQLKERRAEIKKLEKKLKVECQTSVENAELNSKIEQLERDLQLAKQKHNEERIKYTEENQKLLEMKKTLQQEIACATNEMERLHAQIDEKGSHVRKLESNFKQDRQQAQTSLKEASERAKKAETNLLEFKMEIALKTLQRSLEECQLHIGQIEEFSKKYSRNQPGEDLKWLTTYLQDWQKTKEKITETLNKTKTDFSQQIDAVKAGKPLSLLPTLDIPKPPAPPPTPKQFLLLNQPHEQKQPIAPIGVPSKTRSFSPNVVANGIVPPRSAPSVPSNNAGNATPVAQPQYAQPNLTSSLSTPAAERPYSAAETNMGGGASEMMTGAYAQQQQNIQQQQLQQISTTSPNSSGMANTSSNNAAPGHRNDFTPWSDPLHGLTQSLFGSKAFTGVAGFDGFGAQHQVAMGNGGSYQSQLQGNKGNAAAVPVTSVGAGGGQWSNWGGYQQQMFGNRPNQQQHHHVSNDQPFSNGLDSRNAAAYMRSTSRTATDGTSPQPSYENSLDSPISNDKSKQVDAVAEQLRIMFPHLSPDIIRDNIHEFRSMQYNRSLKGLTGEQVFNGVVSIIYSRQQKQQQQQGSWNPMPQMNNAFDTMGGGEMGLSVAAMAAAQYNVNGGVAYDDMCTICCNGLRGSEVYTLPCNHTFHSACVTPWLSSQPNCPICCAYTVPPEEYPDLA